MSPEKVARHIQTGLSPRYMVVASAALPGQIMAVCPANCAFARNISKRRPDLVMGIYDRGVTEQDLIRDLPQQPKGRSKYGPVKK